MIATISSRGQVSIPRPVRKKLGWKAGDRLFIESDDEGQLLLGKVTSPAEDFVALLAACPQKGFKIPRLPVEFPGSVEL